MDHGSKQEAQQGKTGKRQLGLSEAPDKIVQRAIRRVRSPSRPRTWVPRSYKQKAAGKFNKFGREDHVHKPGFNNNQGRPHFNKKFFFNRRERFRQQQQQQQQQRAAADRNRDKGYKKKSGEGNSLSQQNSVRLFQPRSTSSRDQDRRSGSKSDKSQSRERDHGGSRSREKESELSSAKQAAARERAIQKKRKEIDQVDN